MDERHFGCGITSNEADLQRSHCLCKALYRPSSADGELPILASPDLIIQDQKQIADYVFCCDCEQRFSAMIAWKSSPRF